MKSFEHGACDRASEARRKHRRRRGPADQLRRVRGAVGTRGLLVARHPRRPPTDSGRGPCLRRRPRHPPDRHRPARYRVLHAASLRERPRVRRRPAHHRRHLGRRQDGRRRPVRRRSLQRWPAPRRCPTACWPSRVLGGVAPTQGPDAIRGGAMELGMRVAPLLKYGGNPLRIGASLLVQSIRPVASPALYAYAAISPRGRPASADPPRVQGDVPRRPAQRQPQATGRAVQRRHPVRPRLGIPAATR